MGMQMLEFFTTRQFDFRSEKFQSLRQEMSEEENQIFYTNTEIINVDDYLKWTILGGRQYCLKEPLSSLPKARRQLIM